MTRIAGVAGQPIGHSLSPLIHGAWIAAAGLNARYDAFEPADETGFAALAQRVRAGDLAGLNVTAPFKAAAFALADGVSDTARRCGSANLLIRRDGVLWADSTDGRGLSAALAEQAPGLDLAEAPVVVLGAGGAARAAVAALIEAGARVTVVNRTLDRAEALAADLGAAVGDSDSARRAGLIVNALSAAPTLDMTALRPDAVLMDMSYRPVMTPFLAAGRARGLITVDGLAMLIGQARPSFEAFFGVAPPAIDVRTLALEAAS
ncbi:shikimate dehydrogenase family protein [Brevundimonas sp.]|uniref:shikimate dehydrogenase family protein n=1 Tax=Brevundimonas sp. TaxID=1871086 RepID=UPI002FD972F3